MHSYIYRSYIQVYTVNCGTIDCNSIIFSCTALYFFFSFTRAGSYGPKTQDRKANFLNPYIPKHVLSAFIFI